MADKLICTMPVRNEDWVLGLSLRAVLLWCDEVVVLNHASTDRTPDILEEIQAESPGRVTVLLDHDPQWSEMAHRQRLLEEARRHEATHIVMVDADEVLTANLLPVIRALVQATPQGHVLQLPWICLRGDIGNYHSAGVWAQQDVSMAFRDEPRAHWAARDGYDFHHRHPMGMPHIPYRPLRTRGQGGLMHLQFVSEARLRAKQYLYQLTERLRWPDREPVDVVRKRYQLAVYGDKSGSPHVLKACPDEWWLPYGEAGLVARMKPGAEPWQSTEIRKILRENTGIGVGLDSFGIEEQWNT